MRKFIIGSALVVSAVALAAPASAQYYPQQRGYGYGHGGNIDQQLERIEDRIRRAADRGRITRREEYRLLRQVERLDRLEDHYSRNGLTRWEHRDLQNRLQNLRQQLRWERWDDRRDRYDRDDRHDRDDDDRWDDD